MKIQNLMSGLLVAAALASCDKNTSTADKTASPAPSVTVKASGTVKPATDDVPKAHVDSSTTPPK